MPFPSTRLATLHRSGYKPSKHSREASNQYQPTSMKLPSEVMLAANALIHWHGNGAEEYAARQLWESRRTKDEKSTSYCSSMLEALKPVRELRAKVEHGS
jgi:hypothetical protein